jgi:hypothetical protein
MSWTLLDQLVGQVYKAGRTHVMSGPGLAERLIHYQY